ncbi:MAG: PAS domain S-box protein [candidate division NC10 bacterium]|nr:PAS domain S-box protein [candidate division NC10 bacterium]
MKNSDGMFALLTRKDRSSPIYDFAALRVAVILGGYGWLILDPLAPPYRSSTAFLLHAFTLYCILLYVCLTCQQGRVMRLNVLVLVIDLAFALSLIRLTGGVASPFYLALYLIAALQTYYYGIGRGVGVLFSSALLYLVAVWPTWQPTSASVVSLRLGFMVLVVAPLGILSERERWRRRELQEVNSELREKSARLEEVYAQQRVLQEHLENIMSSITNGIIAVDRQGRVTALNRVVEARNGIASAEVIGRPLAEVLPAFEKEGVTEALRGLLLGESGEIHLREVEHQTQKQGKIIVNFDGYPLRDANEELRGAVLVIEDVTRRVALEQQMRRAEKLSALGTLSAGLAHEINNPLGVITSRVEVALMEAEGKDIPKQLIDDLKVIDKHAHRAARVTQGLLSFSRPAAAHLQLLDLNAVVEETLLLIEKQLEKERIILERHLTPDLPKVMGNGWQLEEVLLNLVTNAREAMTAGGRLRVGSRLRTDGTGVQILIADTGEGMPDELVQRIFDPFFTTKENGTGLGLSISYGIVKEHGGTLEVESEVGKGTTFTITLPVRDR